MERLTLPARSTRSPIAGYVKAAAAAAGLDKKATYCLRQAVDEVATNIIVHGYDEAGLSGDIVVGLAPRERTAGGRARGQRAAVRPRTQPPPDDLDRPLEERKIGGLGVYLTIADLDDFDYERLDGRNRNVFIMTRPAAPAAPGAPR